MKSPVNATAKDAATIARAKFSLHHRKFGIYCGCSPETPQLPKKIAAKPTPQRSTLAEELEEALASCERLLGLSLTLIDAHGRFALGQGGTSLFATERRSHRKNPVCEAGFCQRCIEHCRHEVGAQAHQSATPFLHRCWKGAAEIVIPLRLAGDPVGHLFAGIWRGAEESALPAARVALRHLSPVPSRTQIRALQNMLRLFALGLMSRIEADLQQPGEGIDQRIDVFIEQNYHRPVTLADLASALGVSPSRASHLAGEAGRSFQERLLARRVSAAQILLGSEALRINEIARAVGFSDPYYFSRVFHRLTGNSPRQYRQQQPTR